MANPPTLSTQLATLENTQVPAHVAARIGKESKLSIAMAGGISAGSVPRISIKGGRFRIVEDGNETLMNVLELNVVVVGANPRLSKTFYAKQWTTDQEPANPDCFSLDAIKPDPNATSPQHLQCVDCPHNAWGSRTTPNGSQVKACTDQKRLAVVAFEDVSGPIYLIQVPPASLRGLNVYHKELSRRGIPPEVVATRVSLDSDASFPKLVFNFGGFLTPEQQSVVDKLFGAETVLEVTGERVITLPEPAAPAPKMTLAPVKPNVAPNPQGQASAPKPTVAVTPAPVQAAADPAAKKRGFGGMAPTVVQPSAPKPAAPAASVITPDSGLSDLERDIQAMIGGTPDDAAVA